MYNSNYFEVLLVRKLAFVSDIKNEVFPGVFFADLEYLDGYEDRQKAKIVHSTCL